MMENLCDTSSVSSETEDTYDADRENIRFINLIKMYPAGFIKPNNPTASAKALREKTLEEVANAYRDFFGKQLTGKQVQKKVSNLKTRLKAKAELRRTGTKKIVLRQHEKIFLQFLRQDESPSSKKICEEFMTEEDAEIDKEAAQLLPTTVPVASVSNTSTLDSVESQESSDISLQNSTFKCDTSFEEPTPARIFTEIQRTPVPLPLVENLSPPKIAKPEIPRKEIYYISDACENFEFNRVLLFEEF